MKQRATEIVCATVQRLSSTPAETWSSRLLNALIADVAAALEKDAAVGVRKCPASATSDPPQDCDAPFCGCDPAWSYVIDALRESGWFSREEVDARVAAREGELNHQWALVKESLVAGAVAQERAKILDAITRALDAASEERYQDQRKEEAEAAKYERESDMYGTAAMLGRWKDGNDFCVELYS